MGQKAVRTDRSRPVPRAPGLGGLRIPRPRMPERCRGGDALLGEVVPRPPEPALVLPRRSALPAASSVPEPPAEAEGGIWDRGRGGGSRTRHETGEQTLKNEPAVGKKSVVIQRGFSEENCQPLLN